MNGRHSGSSRQPLAQHVKTVAFVMDADTPPDHEIQALLRNRLRGAGLIFLGMNLLTLVLALFGPVGIDRRFLLPLLLVCTLMAVPLAMLFRRRRPLSLQGLRSVEVIVFGIWTAFMGWALVLGFSLGWPPPFAREGHERLASILIGDKVALPWFTLMVTYGTFIPNTGRRCAVIVTLMALTPLLITVGLDVYQGVEGRALLHDMLQEMALWIATGAVIAIYGSHKIHALRQEALKARQLGRYRLTRKLGAGNMGEVYLAEHQWLRRPCAVKLIRPERAADPKALIRFEREVQAMASLTHWNTVEIFDYGHADDGTFYYVMEYLPGLNLQELVDQHGPLPPGRVVHLLRQACAALGEAHAVGLVHRDVKPGNILVCERGGVGDVVKLTDFGLVQLPSTADPSGKATLEGKIVGTPLYMSPEQIAGKDLPTSGSDLYSLGAVAYFLLTGQAPFVRETAMLIFAAHLHDPVVPLTELRTEVPLDLQEVVLKCLEKNPSDRFPDSGRLEKALSQCRCSREWGRVEADAWWSAHHQQ